MRGLLTRIGGWVRIDIDWPDCFNLESQVFGPYEVGCHRERF